MSTSTALSKNDEKDSPRRTFLPFPDIIEERIDTEQFITASRRIVKVLDKFGKLFAPLTYEMRGSIQKLSTRYLVDIEVNANLQDMILLEVAIGESTTITESLLWLTSCLRLIQLFLERIVGDCKAGKGAEDVMPILKLAYEQSLDPYHGWMAKQLFGLLSRMVPSRTYILQTLASDDQDKLETTLDILDDFTKGLRNNITSLLNFYDEYGLDNRRLYITG